MGILNPLVAIIVSFCFLGVLMYKRVNLGIVLNATAMILALLALSWQEIPSIVYETLSGFSTVSVVLATFGIMLLSGLYRETGFIRGLTESLEGIIRNPKIVISLLPAVIGFLPVAGGALMSAPIVESEGEKLKLKTEKKTYANLWFRHTIFPVYPLSQVLILTAALAGTTVASLIVLQIPVVIIMIIVGYVISFWKTSNSRSDEDKAISRGSDSNVRTFIITFVPILTTIMSTICLELVGSEFSRLGFNVLIATIVGIVVLTVISRMNLQTFVKPLKSWGIYGVTLAAFGAFLLGNVVKALGISEIFETLVANGSVDSFVLLTVMPGVLGVLTASALGGISISITLLGGILALSPKMASLIYMGSYLGYIIAPTHLCFAFTIEYFKCSLGKPYKYLIPSFFITFATAILIYSIA